jgi:hypothetical protein
MGYSIVEGKAPGWKPYKPSMEEREANAAFIVRAVNAHDALVKALEDISKQHTSEELRAIVAKECAMSEAARSWHSSASLADFEGGYDECVKIARAALAQVKP